MEMPWWAYGPSGMQLWFPSSLSAPLSPRHDGQQCHDMELEFDQEVYPIGRGAREGYPIGRGRGEAREVYP